MLPKRVRLTPALLLPLVLSCSTGTLVPLEQSMPAARAGLRPEYRLFYDALEDQGDWKLIEPLGWVFRPRVSFVAWRPYQEGFWVPSDVFGWIWVSAEPFGWATYHYGRWAYDRFDGWIWIPGAEWGPAWVEWAANDAYVGWAPTMFGGSDPVPGGVYTFLPIGQLASTDIKTRLLKEADVAPSGTAHSVRNEAEADGVVFNRGPRLDWVERFTGPLDRVKTVDMVSPDRLIETKDLRADAVRAAAAPDTTERAGVRAARQTRGIIERKDRAPVQLPVVRPLGSPGKSPVAPARQADPPRRPKRSAARADSSR